MHSISSVEPVIRLTSSTVTKKPVLNCIGFRQRKDAQSATCKPDSNETVALEQGELELTANH
jgi:hypothetical protein